MTRAFITGGSGVVGRAVVATYRAAGWEVAALARSEAAGHTLRQLGADVVAGDLFSSRVLTAAMEGADVVVHVAGLNTVCSDRAADLHRVNVDGTRNVVRAAAAAGAGRLVHTSSATVFGSRGGSSWNAYAESKFLADEVVKIEATGLGLPYVLIAPSSVQGPGRATGTGKLIADTVAGRLRVLVDSTFSIVDIDDCAVAHLAAATTDAVGGPHLVSGFSTTAREAVARLADIAGLDLAVRFVPARLAGLAAPLAGIAGRLTGQELCPAMVRTLTRPHLYDGTAAAQTLRISYRSADDTYRRLLEWLRDEGFVERPLPGLDR